ncbi:hypothetical protein ACWX0K_14875 [Nitrobacteraceae bacterium UC4446_H13]
MSSMIPLNDAEIQDIATAAADAAVRKLFLTMGVDTSDDKAMLEMQRDFAHVRTWRKSVETVRRQTLLAAVGVIVSGILGAVYMAFSRGGH